MRKTDQPIALVRAIDPQEQNTSLEDIFEPHSFRWAIYDRPSRTIYFGSSDIKTHMSVAEASRLLSNPPSYYRPGPEAQMFGGFICRGWDGSFYYDPYSGTFPAHNSSVGEAEQALHEFCESQGLPWKRYDPKEGEFQH